MAEMPTPAEEEGLLEAIVRKELMIKELQEEVSTLKSFYKSNPEAYPAGTVREVGRFTIRITESTRVDTDLANQKLPVRRRAGIFKQVIDSAKAKAYLTPEEYASIQKHYENKVEVKINV